MRNSPTSHSVLKVLLLLAAMHAARGAPPLISTVGENHARWNTASGFAGGHVYSIAQTGDGYLWIGASNGLLRFDGFSFVAVRPGVSEAAANLSMVSVATDADGGLWTSNGIQMFHLENGVLKAGLPVKGPQPNQDIVIAKAPGGALIFAAGMEGISYLERGRAQPVVAAGEVPAIPVSIAQGEDGALWIGTHIGLFRAEPGQTNRSAQRIEGLQNITVNSMLPLSGGKMLIATDKGLWYWDGTRVAAVDTGAGLKSKSILALARDLDGGVWIGSEVGLFKVDASSAGAGVDAQSLEKVSSAGAVTALFADREGNMWVGGIEGIERIRANAFSTYSFPGSVPSENSGPIHVDSETRTWFAPSEGGLFWFRKGRLEHVANAGLNHDLVYSIAGRGDDLWLGRKQGGLTRLRVRGDTMDAVTYTRRNGLAQDAVYSVHASPDGAIWAGTLNQGLSRLRNGLFTRFSTTDGLPSNTITAIEGSESESLFAGTPDGLGELRGGHWYSYAAREGLPPGVIDCLLRDSTGTLWIGTTKGIAFLHSGAIQVPSKIPSPLSEEILGIAESSDGWLWISTPEHVLRVRRDPLRNGALKETDYREYGEADGLASVEGVRRTRSVVPDERGRVWFSLNRGISVVQPRVLARQSVPPLIHLDRMADDEKTVKPASNIRIPSGRHRLTFYFASVSLTNPDRIRYRYRLDDFDSSWSDPVAIREANYTNLPPGKFRFRVMARNADGLWSAEEAGIAFTVEPAYWQTWWFQIAGIVALFAIGWGIYRLRLLQLTRSLNLRFEERLAERARIGRELHDTLLQNLTGLALQISGLAKIVKEPARATEGLLQLKRQAEDCVRETRQSVWEIRSNDAEIEDLSAALEQSGKQLTNGKAIRFDFACEGVAGEVPPQTRQHLLRIAREAVANAVRHAAPSEIRLTLKFSVQEIQLRVSDDGSGFDVAAKNELSGHFGLATMKERAQQMKASIDIESTAETGTSVVVRVPREARRTLWLKP